jgi:hypothetical protein
VVAIEGPRKDMVCEVGRAVEKILATVTELRVKIWTGDRDAHQTIFEQDDLLLGTNQGAYDFADFAQAYSSTVSSWYQKSKEIVKYVRGGGNVSQANQRKTPPSTDQSSSSSKMTPIGTTSTVPIALIQEGFSLTLADRAACATPLVDRYSPSDHWQWMATLWRGIVGADLTVYVKPCLEDETLQRGTVDLHMRQGYMVVRVPLDKGFDEATERRMAFEMAEWLREGCLRDHSQGK